MAAHELNIMTFTVMKVTNITEKIGARRVSCATPSLRCGDFMRTLEIG